MKIPPKLAVRKRLEKEVLQGCRGECLDRDMMMDSRREKTALKVESGEMLVRHSGWSWK